MPLEHIISFLFAIIVVFTLSGLLMLLAARPASSDPFNEFAKFESTMQEPFYFDEPEGQTDETESDEDSFAEASTLSVPHIELPGAHAGGGVTEQAFCKVSGVIALDEDKDPNENREYNRRLKDRRSSETRFTDDDRRILERRILLRRNEDHLGKRLIDVTEAADVLGVSVERIYRWLDKTDIPFCHVGEGKNKKLRFEISTLLRWYGALSPNQDRR